MKTLKFLTVLTALLAVLCAVPASGDIGEWEWQNRLPQGNSLYDVWGSSESDVFAVGYFGTILHYDGSSWADMSSGTSEHLSGVWGSSGSDVFTVGNSGTILHYDGNSWADMSFGTSNDFYSVWGSSESDVFAVGQYGTILHYNGSLWTDMNSGTSNWLSGVWGSSGSDVFAVGRDGKILHYNGSSWTDMSSGTSNSLSDVWGSSGSDVFAVGSGTILHYDGNSWADMSFGTSNGFYGVWGSSESDVFAVGDSGTILHYNGRFWTDMSFGTSNSIFGVWGSSESDIFAVGDSGTILNYNGSSWADISSGTSNRLYVMWGSSGSDVFAVGDSGTILHYDGRSWADMSSGTSNSLSGVWGSSESDIFAVGSYGTILHYDGNSWAHMSSGTSNTLLDVWGSSESDVFTVRLSGTILHYDGNSWTDMSSGTSNQILDVWGSSGSDVFAVGSYGTILHYDGNSWTDMSSGTLNTLYGVWGNSGSDIFVVGYKGTILHYDGSSWTDMSSGTSNQLHGVWGSSGSDVFAVGSYGTILHYDGSSWADMRYGTLNTLYGVWGSSESDVFAVGDSGTILHYDKGSPILPTITTATISNITPTTASSGGNITSDGNAPVTRRGVCWNTSSNPATSDNKTENGAGTGSFISSLTGLTPGVTYYVRAYATNSAGTAYGSEVSFITVPPDPTGLTTDEASDGKVVLKWNQILYPFNVNYLVYRSETKNGIYYKVNTHDIDHTHAFNKKVEFTDCNLKNGITYHYKIKSLLNGLESENFSDTVSATPISLFDFECRLISPIHILSVGTRIKYNFQLLPLEKFQGTLNLSCAGLPYGLSYEFLVNGENRGTNLSGLILPVLVTLEITAGSAAPVGRHQFRLQAQNTWEGGSSEFLTTVSDFSVTERNEEGIHAEVEKNRIYKGEQARIYGSVYPPLENRKITLSLTDTDTGDSQVKNLYTTTGGRFEELNWISTLDMGNYKISASWTDDTSDTHTSETRSFTVEKGKPVLTCLRESGKSPSVGEDFTVLGRIKPVFAHIPLIFTVTDPDGTISDQTVYTDASGEYEIADSFFSKNGIWKFKTCWKGNDDYIGCESDFLEVPVGVDFGRAIVLAGGKAEQNNSYWNVTKTLSVAAYRDFKASGFNDDMIHFMINSQSVDINYDDRPDNVVDDDLPTAEDLADAVKTEFKSALDPETPLFVYMQGHGTSDRRFRVLGSDQFVTGTQIKDALDTVQAQTKCRVIIILECCYSGNFIRDLSGPDRVILTSAGNEPYKTDASGRISFSRYVFSKLSQGDPLKKAFDYARNKLVNMGYPSPQLDDNGNGKADSADGVLAANIHLGGTLLWGIKPDLEEVTSLSMPEQGFSTVPLTAKVIPGDAPVKRVWAQVIPPNANITGADETIVYPEADLSYKTGTGLYEGT